MAIINIKCKFCKKDIQFVDDVNGKKIPLDINHSKKGRYIIVGETTYKVSSGYSSNHPKDPRYEIHVKTCDYPDMWRKK